MKECYICFNSIFHGIIFNCKHEICVQCFMKIKQNLCPYCRFPIYEVILSHYSNKIPVFLKKICFIKDIFSYVLLQIYYSEPSHFNINSLIRDIKTWSIMIDLKNIYIMELKVLYKYIHPEKKQVLLLLCNLSFLSWFFRNDFYEIEKYPHPRYLYFYPIFVFIHINLFIYTLYILYLFKQINKFQYVKRKEIKIENIME